MGRRARMESSTGLYHVMVRGAGKQILFEDKRDYKRYIDKLDECRRSMKISIIAYCLMNNHVHLLVQADSAKALASMMRRIGTSYASFYNKKYDHCGNVFQGRYLSKTIETETNLLRCVRYIHNNPAKAKFGNIENYPWSSYNDYFAGGGITDTELVLNLIGGRDNFARFSREVDHIDDNTIDVEDTITLKVGNEIISEYLENKLEIGTIVKKLNCQERDEIILSLKAAGLSNRQIELLTGVSREVIKRVK